MPKRGEVWWVNFDPTIGDEIQKTRPVVVIGSDSISELQNKIVVPIRSWRPRFSNLFWMVEVKPTVANGLQLESGADAAQIKSISVERFTNKIGRLPASELEDIVAAVALCIEYE
jgi:mRNA interferase MazF